MEMALYDPAGGYYATSAHRIGTDGADFFTASDAGEWFGRCLTRQIGEFDAHLGHPRPFDVVEWGAGRGLLARDVRGELRRAYPELDGRARYWAVDRSPAMRAAAGVHDGVEAIAPDVVGQRPGAYEGCAIAVELFDALPVHRIRRRGGRFREVAVGLDAAAALRELEVEPSPSCLAEMERWGLAPAEGREVEVSLALPETLRAMTAALRRGFVVVADYGRESAGPHGPTQDPSTLLAYSRHRTSTDFLVEPGSRDLTAHVPWTALVGHGRELGLRFLGSTTQDRFLIANGILEAFGGEPAEHGRPERVRERMRAMTLIHPDGMGRAFQVYLFAKGLDAVPDVRGLDDPFAR